jgi:ferrous iron transport protein A
LQIGIILNKMDTISTLKIGEIGIIKDGNFNNIPLKLQELGCLPGVEVELIQTTISNDPIHIRINDTHIAIRKSLASEISIEKTIVV